MIGAKTSSFLYLHIAYLHGFQVLMVPLDRFLVRSGEPSDIATAPAASTAIARD